MANKLKSSQLKYLSICNVLTLFEESYKVTGLAIYFPNFKTPFQSRNYKQMLKGFYLKSLKSYKACIKEKIIFHKTLSKMLPQKIHFQNCSVKNH